MLTWYDRLVEKLDPLHERTVILRCLYDTIYYSDIAMDDNRRVDAISYRHSVTDEEYDSPANCLEVLYVLSRKCEKILYDPSKGSEESQQVEFFWLMIENLGLIEYSDDDIKRNPEMVDEINRSIDKWLKRRFRRDGYGSPFFIPGERNMNNIELWQAATRWLTFVQGR